MTWHFVEGEEGCDFARQNGHVAIIVDALRASATAAMLLDVGALEIIAVTEVNDALDIKRETPEVLLFGERDGLPPDRFDFGNSPRTVQEAKGRRVVFTTTTGAGRLVSAWGAHACYMGSTVNASAVARSALRHDRDIVVVPAGLAGDPLFDAQEDWTAAVVIAMASGDPELGMGADQYQRYADMIRSRGITDLFRSSVHAGKLGKIGLDADVDFCAQVDITQSVPKAVRRDARGVAVKEDSLV